MVVILLISLGVWQLNRMSEKQTRLDSIAQKTTTAPMHPLDVPMQWEDVRDVPVQFTGTLQANRVLLVDNQIYQGKPGYDVIVPVVTRGQQLLVNLGWIAAPRFRKELPQLTLTSDTIFIKGVTSQAALNPLIQETQTRFNQFPVVIQQLDISLINQQWSTAMPDLVVTRLSSQPDIQQLVAEWQPVVMPPEKHLGYAVQWFGLAIAALVISVSVLIRRAK